MVQWLDGWMVGWVVRPQMLPMDRFPICKIGSIPFCDVES